MPREDAATWLRIQREDDCRPDLAVEFPLHDPDSERALCRACARAMQLHHERMLEAGLAAGRLTLDLRVSPAQWVPVREQLDGDAHPPRLRLDNAFRVRWGRVRRTLTATRDYWRQTPLRPGAWP